MKILVTGADGFIGSHLVEKLILEGHDVKAFVLYNSFGNWGWLDQIEPNILNHIEVIMGDVRDKNILREAINKCDTIIHLAALIAIPYSYKSPESYVETNVKGTLNVLQIAKDFEIEKVIHTSTSEVYGSAQYVPMDEKHPIVGQSPYSASKIAADQLAISFFSSFNTPVSIVRPFNTFGPRQSARAIIPSIITQIANGEKEIKLGDLSPKRDFNYIDDTINGFVCALNSKESIGEIINLGSNYELSIADVVSIIIELMEVDVKIVEDSSRIRPKKSEVLRLLADNSKAKNILNWEPQFSGEKGFRKAISNTINWIKVPKNLNKYKHLIYNV